MIGASLAVLALAAASAPRAVEIQPRAQTIPATTLRLYVVFDKSARGWVRQNQVKLLTADGQAIVPSPFMDFGQELWSTDGRRLTVLFDPGRVKRDVEGPGSDAAPLKPGRAYQIEVGAYRTSFRVGPPNRSPLDPKNWQMSSPPTKSGPLQIVFDRVMDSALVTHQLKVTTPDGKPVEGRTELTAEGTTWRFIPKSEWRPGTYRVVVGTVLEDVSGNRMSEALDHDVGRADVPAVQASLPFEIDWKSGASMPSKPSKK
jgi:Bacterial Ig-like domain